LKLNATTEDRIKYNLCKNIVHHAIKNDLHEEELKLKLEVDQEKLDRKKKVKDNLEKYLLDENIIRNLVQQIKED
ncbi:12694_t:CDS:2, partial [Racocetra persica]